MSEVNISVAAGGTLIWRPGTQIAARQCRHSTVTRVDLAEDARVYAREEVLLGRYQETPGNYRQRLRVTSLDSAIYDQELSVGSTTPGWETAAVTGGRHALGSILVIDPGDDSMVRNASVPLTEDCPDTAVLKLSEHAALISSLAHDAVELRRRLDTSFARIATIPERV